MAKAAWVKKKADAKPIVNVKPVQIPVESKQIEEEIADIPEFETGIRLEPESTVKPIVTKQSDMKRTDSDPKLCGRDGEFFVSTCASTSVKCPSGRVYDLTKDHPIFVESPEDVAYLKTARRVEMLSSRDSVPAQTKIQRPVIKGLKTVEQLEVATGFNKRLNPF